jgi:hypothetical protein
MKFHAVFFGLLLVLATATRVSAQFMSYDSAALGSPLIFPNDIQDTLSMFGGPDGNCAQFVGDAECAVRFVVGTESIPIQKGDSIHIYWKIPSVAPGDSNVAHVHLQDLDESFILRNDLSYFVWESSPLNVEEMQTIVVPDTGFNTIAINVATDTGGNSFWLDAIELVQKGTASVARGISSGQPVLANYPNPFYHASGTRVQVHAPAAGIGMLSVMDALGQEVARVPLGAISMGDQDVNIALERAGIFFVRLFVDGAPVGSPLEISGE